MTLDAEPAPITSSIMSSRCVPAEAMPSNMQWQTIADAKRKDVEEARQCRAMRRPAAPRV
jgi:hypothetical protein